MPDGRCTANAHQSRGAGELNFLSVRPHIRRLPIGADVEEGVVPGGDRPDLIRVLKALKDLEGANEDQTVGIRLLARSIEEPLRPASMATWGCKRLAYLTIDRNEKPRRETAGLFP